MSFNWHNIGSNLTAILAYIYSQYPDLSPATIYGAIQDGTIIPKALALLSMYYLYNYEGTGPKIQYITEDK